VYILEQALTQGAKIRSFNRKAVAMMPIEKEFHRSTADDGYVFARQWLLVYPALAKNVPLLNR
jgi:hypothetical protein